ncbi:hypothetical protein [Bizionia paragorgiae]|uniref:Uncharacterized protein n=1 Tax=Bizionia paragorgiae TaxID=283786 RepID=A0A1H4CIP9_BIZPA|nr:hypothetical protein [Bizionia paragorgiae]SEA60285.1 hypothetical protein SAMN04487990_12016 [Bizionia paragorgiae]
MIKPKHTILLVLFLVFSCNNDKREAKTLTEVFDLNKNKNLLEELLVDNDSVSFGWRFQSTIISNHIDINIYLYNNRPFTSNQSQLKLKNESQKISTKLKTNLTDISEYEKLNFYLVSGDETIDSLKIKVKDLKK